MTIKDLAEKTGYGVATVSRVLNNQPNVSEKAREIIMQAVEESGFQLNVNAKQLKQQHVDVKVLDKFGGEIDLKQTFEEDEELGLTPPVFEEEGIMDDMTGFGELDEKGEYVEAETESFGDDE